MGLFKQVAGVTRDDIALDVACGPGLVVCAFATVARHVTGVDITPAMLEQARALQQREGLTNVEWKLGDGTKLPFEDESFSLVLSRYAFHHFENPKAVLAEMVRVCQPGGRVCVADVYVTSDAQDEAYNRIELLRDPSHVRHCTWTNTKRYSLKPGCRSGSRRFIALTWRSTCCWNPRERQNVRRRSSVRQSKLISNAMCLA